MSDGELTTKLALIAQRLEGIEESVEETRSLLTGNGRPEDGLIVKVDRIERQASTASYVVAVLFVAVASVVAKTVWDLMTR